MRFQYNNGMKYRFIIWLYFWLLLVPLVLSCKNLENGQVSEVQTDPEDILLGGVPQAVEHSIIPGECLKSPILSYDDNGFRDIHTIGGLNISGWINPGILPPDIDYSSRVFTIPLKMDIDVIKDTLLMTSSGFCLEYRFAPTDLTYEQFGTNATTIKKEYDTIYNAVCFPDSDLPCRYTTILYERKLISLTANIPFAGSPAHEDFGSHIYVGIFRYDETLDVPGVEYGDSIVALNYGIVLFIPVEDYQITNEAVTLTLEMPVKVGMYLHWLNDRLTNPDAKIQYRDETLTCKFTIYKGLR